MSEIITYAELADAWRLIAMDLKRERDAARAEVEALRARLALAKEEPIVANPVCPECGGDLGGTDIGRLENHESGCPRFPL